MNVLVSFLLVVLVSVGWTGTALADFPEGMVYRVFQFPDSLLPVMDGDLSDWDIVPEKYWTGTRNPMETVKGLGTDFDEEDLSVRTVVGWNDAYNRLYFMVEAYQEEGAHNLPGVVDNSLFRFRTG